MRVERKAVPAHLWMIKMMIYLLTSINNGDFYQSATLNNQRVLTTGPHLLGGSKEAWQRTKGVPK